MGKERLHLFGAKGVVDAARHLAAIDARGGVLAEPQAALRRLAEDDAHRVAKVVERGRRKLADQILKYLLDLRGRDLANGDAAEGRKEALVRPGV